MANQKVQAEFQPIPIDLIEVGPEQARTSKVEEGIDELTESIKRFGLLHPVTVFPKEGRYILVSGQRRLLAAKQLGWEEIPANVLSTPPDAVEAKAISFSENFMRRDLTRAEKRDACIIFHRRYRTMKAASKALGIPYTEVREYVKYDRLDNELKKLVDDGTVKVDEALQAQDISEGPDGSIAVEEAKRVAGTSEWPLPSIVGETFPYLLPSTEETIGSDMSKVKLDRVREVLEETESSEEVRNARKHKAKRQE